MNGFDESDALDQLPVSVVVPTYNRQQVVCDTILSVLAQGWQRLEIIIVDQTASTCEALSQLIAAHPDRVRYHRQAEANLPKARNTGVLLARHETLLFLDDDVLLPPGFIANHARRLWSHERIGAVTGPQLSSLSEADSTDAVSRFIGEFDLQASILETGYSDASWFAGCNFSVKRSVLEKTGPFDETFTGSAYCEDVDMAVRVREVGFRVIFDRGARLVHLALQSGGCETRNQSQAEVRARERFRHLLYCRLKHVRIQGPGLSVRLIWRAYRSYLINRLVFAQGVAFACERAAATAVDSWGVLARLRDLPPLRPGWTTIAKRAGYDAEPGKSRR